MQKTVDKLERFFWFYLLLNPVLDIVSGLYIKVVADFMPTLYNNGSMTFTPSLVVRMIVLLVLVAYIFMIRDWRSVAIAVPMGLAWVLSVVSEYLCFGGVSLFIDVQYFARFAYNIAVMLVYYQLFLRTKLTREQIIDRIHHYFALSLILLTLAIIIPYVLGLGYTTYADRFGFRGTRGYFYSGNDITGAFMILFPLATCYLLQLPKEKLDRRAYALHALPPAMTLLCMALIGTKTAFLAIGISLGGIILYALVRAVKGDREAVRRLAIVLLLLLLVGAATSLLSSVLAGTSVMSTIRTSLDGFSYAAGEGEDTLFFNGRLTKLSAAAADFKQAGPLAWIFGVGRGSQVETVEMDLCEVLLYYGVFGACTMLWLYFKKGILFVVDMFRHFNVLALGAFLSLGLCVAYLTIAGHMLFSVTSGFYFSFALIYGELVTGRIRK